MSEDQNLFVENIREALRTYERFLVLSIFSSALVLAYSFDKPGALVSIGYGQIRIEFAFFAAVILYFFCSFAARYALILAADNARLVTAPEKRAALGLLPSVATDHRSSFRVPMLAAAPLLILTAFTTEFVQSTEPLSQRPLVGYIGFGLFVVVTAYSVWEKLRDFERVIARPSPEISMTDLLRDLPIPPGYRSREAALFVAQMEDQSRRLTKSTRDLTPEELAWQSQPGMNTIGMLLAHIAIVEVDWMQIGPLGRTSCDVVSVLGINEDDDGMPLAENAEPPQILAGRDLASFDDLLARAREFTRLHAMALTDADLDRRAECIQDDGSRLTFTVRWALYHMLEHLAGHFGQILLLRHAFRVSGAKR